MADLIQAGFDQYWFKEGSDHSGPKSILFLYLAGAAAGGKCCLKPVSGEKKTTTASNCLNANIWIFDNTELFPNTSQSQAQLLWPDHKLRWWRFLNEEQQTRISWEQPMTCACQLYLFPYPLEYTSHVYEIFKFVNGVEMEASSHFFQSTFLHFWGSEWRNH